MKGFSDNEDGLCPVHLKLAANLTEYPQTYGCPQCAVNHIEELKEELADRDRTILSLRAAIESAPHENACRFRVCVCGEGYSTSTRHGCASPQRKDCNCWKSILTEMSEALDAVRIALEFYANAGNWIGETLTGLPDSMPRSDGGGIAQDALDRLAKGAANVCDADIARLPEALDEDSRMLDYILTKMFVVTNVGPKTTRIYDSREAIRSAMEEGK